MSMASRVGDAGQANGRRLLTVPCPRVPADARLLDPGSEVGALRLVSCVLFTAVAFATSGCEAPGSGQHVAAQTASAGLPRCASETATGCQHVPCTNSGPAPITASPIDLKDIAFIVPMGTMIGGHVTPIDHGYFYVNGAIATPTYQVPVWAPLTGTITQASRTVRQGPGGNYDDYALSVDATCTFRVRFSNLVRFAGRFGGSVGPLQAGQQVMPDFKVTAGELIGYTGLPTAYGIDVWVENDSSVLTGFVHPDQYTSAEAWKTHVVDLFDNTVEPLRSELLALDLRDAAPRWGKIDYDIEGKLVGNWFRAGTGGYAGLQRLSEGYWEGHLAAVYDGIDPTAIELSFGDFAGQAAQYLVVGNAPDPAQVSESSGVVKYELAGISYYSAVTGMTWDRTHYARELRARPQPALTGTVLMQVVATEMLKVEIFPNKAAAQVGGFDTAAQIYVR